MPTKQFLNPQLEEIKSQLDAASQKAISLVDGLSFEHLNQRPQHEQWSIAECLVHLNLSSEAEIEEIDRVLAQTPPGKARVENPLKMDLLGRFLKWTLEPPPMFFSKMKTTEPFQPLEVEPVGDVLPAFLAWQDELKKRVDASAAALPLDRVKIASPFDRRFKYNLFSFFHILLAHERRHLWQAERVKEAIWRQ